ncbi:MAG: VOC family protein [bacterium]
MEQKIQSVRQIAIAVHDIESSVHFYNTVLGLELLFEVPTGLAFFDCGGTRLMLTTLQGPEQDHHTSVIYYLVDDLEAYVAQLKARGIQMEREPQLAAKMDDHDLWIAFLRDPDQNLVGLMSEVQY